MNVKQHKTRASKKSGANKHSEGVLLSQADRTVFSYFDYLCGKKVDRTCTIGFPATAAACNISERQAQISTGRLIKAGLLKRIGYDFGNAVRSRRGTKYKLLKTAAEINYGIKGNNIEGLMQILLKRQESIESLLEQLLSTQERLLSLVAHLAGQSTSVKYSQRPADKFPKGVNNKSMREFHT